MNKLAVCFRDAWDIDPLYSVKEVTIELTAVVFFVCVMLGLVYFPFYLTKLAGIEHSLAIVCLGVTGWFVEAFVIGGVRSMWKVCKGA